MIIIENISWYKNINISLRYIFINKVAEPNSKHILKSEPWCPAAFQTAIDGRDAFPYLRLVFQRQHTYFVSPGHMLVQDKELWKE